MTVTRASNEEIGEWLTILVHTHYGATKRYYKRLLLDALLSDGHEMHAARIIADKLISERRREAENEFQQPIANDLAFSSDLT